MSQAVSVESLGKGDKEGFLTKCGGRVKTWKKRWFVLKGDTLYYFKTQQDTDLTGSIPLEADSECKEDTTNNVKGKKYHFTISTTKRTFVIYADKEEITKAWVKSVNENIKRNSRHKTRPGSLIPNGLAVGSSPVLPRKQITHAKGAVPFLKEQNSKPLEFWQLWFDSIPPREELQVGSGMEYIVQVSPTLEKLTWRIAGPQSVIIQRMVDFFWTVGAPESEIDRLNSVGSTINPSKIGSWIDMSSKGGLDGGWYFPVEMTIKLAMEAADPGECSPKLLEWAGKHSIKKCFLVGRDMGATGPRPTEYRFHLPGDTYDAQMAAALNAFTRFGFRELPSGAVQVLKGWKPTGMRISVLTCSEGFVRLGLMVPNPSADDALKLAQIVSGDTGRLGPLQKALGGNGPAFAELQITREGFGYGVYKEGFDIVFHYYGGEERG
mmetsp:Transcript_7181/g.10843  ORF Transcript_7181/g.10843 Transcript_7181/m.10843 type:complete len:437 (-) Transcript_7181:69-1379(-)|eukprot:CAMPEP_0201509718 /NCGR_PEP_ID=MMETSP0161_2-20130828/2685_1 /ASSEMBLY_ACC=CAM_ASM_000251 /TAXON_ID=180227 /ORGANISM="Neoparamoeba aestuarina, Strain SoJaBio B1-5/56/2" /LENGTH=436 /DNA_ID=CAMNT_0047904753 /DNA_START=93 /DNA_END=1403 /DNA_ORIENTATION=-